MTQWSGKRGSNPRPSAWKADALPTELLPPLYKTQTLSIEDTQSLNLFLTLVKSKTVPFFLNFPPSTLETNEQLTPLTLLELIRVGLIKIEGSNRSTAGGPGGEGRIRTSEGIANRFTVCPLWPLGNLSDSKSSFFSIEQTPPDVEKEWKINDLD